MPVAAITSAAQTAASESALSAPQLRTLEAFVDRLIPKNHLLGATECGVAVYINRSLGDYLAPEKAAFIAGIEATDAFARRSEDRAFADLSPEKQDALLTAMDNGTAAGFLDARAFFGRVRQFSVVLSPFFSTNWKSTGLPTRGWPFRNRCSGSLRHDAKSFYHPPKRPTLPVNFDKIHFRR